MANLDPRLLPVIGVLTEIGMGWLVYELIEAIRRGDEPPEDEHALALARKQVGQASPDEIEFHTSADSGTTPFVSDNQLQLAVQYVSERVSATLTEMSRSLDALNQIVNDVEGKQPATSRAEPILVLFDGDEERAVRRAPVTAAQARLHNGSRYHPLPDCPPMDYGTLSRSSQTSSVPSLHLAYPPHSTV